MSDTFLHGLEAELRETQIRQHTASRLARRGGSTPPAAPNRHRLAQRLRRVADRLDG
jgi:hypothetical protein